MKVNEALPEYKRYTYADYCIWDDDERWELLDGIPYALSAPNRRHQEIRGSLYYQFHDFLRGKTCKVYAAPFDVRLNADTYDDTVVQPDIVVVCDKSKLDDKGCVGAPDLVIEILSPSTALHDRVHKFKRYLQAGIREYWIVDREIKMVSVHVLRNGEYTTSAYISDDSIPVHVLEGCMIDLSEIFTDESV